MTDDADKVDNADKVVYIPDTMSNWPWQAKFNPLCEEVEAESIAWLASFRPLTPKSQKAHNKARIGILAALVYPDAPRERLRIGNDLLHALYVVDEYADRESGAGVREISAIILHALRNIDEPRPEGEMVIGEIFRDFWARGRVITTPQAEKHFLTAMEYHLQGVVRQAEDREKHVLRNIDTYMGTRRMDSGVDPCFSPCEFHLSIADEAFYHPAVKELRDASIDLIVLDNDVASYNREQATGNENWNILPIVMHQFKLDLYHATEWVAQYHKVVQARFLAAFTRLPSFGPEVDPALQEYVAAIAGWARGNDCWRFESERFFGTKGEEVRKSGKAPLLAKQVVDPELRREKVKVQVIEELEQVTRQSSSTLKVTEV